MFAALNTMRHDMQQKFNLPDNFELSQAYQFFWDKFEKSNYFYQNVIKTAKKPTDSRKVSWLMNEPQNDGGQWDMLCALISKYGVMPKAAMPESFNSSNSRGIDEVLNNKLRHDAVILRKMINEDHANEETIDETRRKMLNSTAILTLPHKNSSRSMLAGILMIIFQSSKHQLLIRSTTKLTPSTCLVMSLVAAKSST